MAWIFLGLVDCGCRSAVGWADFVELEQVEHLVDCVLDCVACVCPGGVCSDSRSSAVHLGRHFECCAVVLEVRWLVVHSAADFRELALPDVGVGVTVLLAGSPPEVFPQLEVVEMGWMLAAQWVLVRCPAGWWGLLQEHDRNGVGEVHWTEIRCWELQWFRLLS